MSEQSPPPPTPEGPLSPDGQYRWDGSQWQAVKAPPPSPGAQQPPVAGAPLVPTPVVKKKGHTGRNILLGIVGLIVLLIIIGVASGGSKSTPTASPSLSASAQAAADKAAADKAVADKAAADKAAADKAATGAAAASQAPLPGMGASDADWNRSHTADTKKDAGSAYNLQPSGTDYYGGVGHKGGYVTGYQIQPNPSISRDAALLAIRHEMPADAQLVLDVKFGACEKVQYQSASVAANLHKAGYYSASDTSEVVDIHLYSPGLMVYDGVHVDSMILFALSDKGDNSDDC